MKRLLIILFCAGSLAISAPVTAQESSIVVNQSQSHSVFKGLFKSVWARLKSLNPSQKQSARAEVVYTAGIRGAEATDTLLKPYWKDDLTRDQSFQAELEKFSLAQAKMDQGELEAAVQSFDEFLGEYGKSDLRPNALFSKGLCLAAIGENESSASVLRQFVDENPNHPMVEDARQVIDTLN